MANFDPEDIKQSVSVKDVAERYCGLHPARNGRVPCPFHNGEDNNLALKDNFYYCFVCHASGDQISFVQNILHVDFVTACKTINEDFGLGLAIDRELTGFEKREMERKRKEREQKREFGNEAKSWRDYEREKAELLFVTCDTILCRMSPRKVGKVTPLWTWATHNIAEAEHYYQKFR